jgi:hypothetical protein
MFLIKPGQVVEVKFAPVLVNKVVSKGRGMETEEVLAATLRVVDATELALALVALRTGTFEMTVVRVDVTEDTVVTTVNVVNPVEKVLSWLLLLLLLLLLLSSRSSLPSPSAAVTKCMHARSTRSDSIRGRWKYVDCRALYSPFRTFAIVNDERFHSSTNEFPPKTKFDSRPSTGLDPLNAL